MPKYTSIHQFLYPNTQLNIIITKDPAPPSFDEDIVITTDILDIKPAVNNKLVHEYMPTTRGLTIHAHKSLLCIPDRSPTTVLTGHMTITKLDKERIKFEKEEFEIMNIWKDLPKDQRMDKDEGQDGEMVVANRKEPTVWTQNPPDASKANDSISRNAFSSVRRLDPESDELGMETVENEGDVSKGSGKEGSNMNQLTSKTINPKSQRHALQHLFEDTGPKNEV
ncbi:hypothetical protein BYT27DRAFT_7262450 [Phlegmacium glaucopus]|nr:hypothetical protein BYT27DRAFT_7262450 [Phlegmacium glaucopus]